MGLGKKVGIGCGVAILGIIAVVGVTFFVVGRMTAEPERVVRDFLSAAAAGDYAKAHDSFAAPLKEQQPLEQFQKTVQETPSLFAIEDVSFNDRSIDTAGAKMTGTVTLKAGTTIPASFELVKERDAWKLISYHLGTRE
jgi:hypothetical protein